MRLYLKKKFMLLIDKIVNFKEKEDIKIVEKYCFIKLYMIEHSERMRYSTQIHYRSRRISFLSCS